MFDFMDFCFYELVFTQVTIRHPPLTTSLTANWAMDPPSSSVVLANTAPLVNGMGVTTMAEDASSGSRTTRFATTPKMSIYLLAFALGEWNIHLQLVKIYKEFGKSM